MVDMMVDMMVDTLMIAIMDYNGRQQQKPEEERKVGLT